MGLLYHLLPASSWSAAVSANEPYTPATFEQDGFTHLTADPALLIPVANTFYKEDAGDWIVLCLDSEKLTHEVKFEQAAPVGNRPPGELQKINSAPDKEPLFPHLYGPIDFEAVVRQHSLQRATDGTFLRIDDT